MKAKKVRLQKNYRQALLALDDNMQHSLNLWSKEDRKQLSVALQNFK